MPVRITATTPAEVCDFDGTTLKEAALLKLLDGVAYLDDTVTPYLDAAVAGELSGGYLRLIRDASGKRLALTIDLESPRTLKPAELKALKEDLAGQISDGIGEGAFDELSRKTDVNVSFPKYQQWKFVQGKGACWKPGKTAKAGLRQTYSAVAKWVKARDAKPLAAARSEAAGEPKTKKSPARVTSFLRLLAKSESVPALKAELAKVGGDLSSIQDKQFPNILFGKPAILKMMLEAGLSPTLMSERGAPLLHSAVHSPEAVQMLLERGVPVDQPCEVSRETPLMNAASFGYLKSVEILLAAGAHANARDYLDESALDHIETAFEVQGIRRNLKVVAALKQAGCTRRSEQEA